VPPPGTDSVDPTAFRRAIGALPTGVTVVSAFGESGPSGATANAVSSLSLDPMLMLACLDRGSRTLRAVQEAGRFGVSVLGEGQEAIARQFATKAPGHEKWEGVEWVQRGETPALSGCVLWIGCELRDVLMGGDHVILTGAVDGIEPGEGRPLVFHAGGYHALPG